MRAHRATTAVTAPTARTTGHFVGEGAGPGGVLGALVLTALVAGGVLWVLSGFGRRLHSGVFQAAHYTVLRLVLAALMRAAQRLFALRLVTDGES